MNNDLLLLSKVDIPFAEAQVNIHQPTLKEIALIGEEAFWSGCNFLNFSKNILDDSDKIDLENYSDFNIFMSMMCNPESGVYKNNALMILALLFPDYQINFEGEEIILVSKEGIARINSSNFDIFKEILKSMFDLDLSEAGGGYNPADRRAEKIAEKLQKAKNRKSQSQEKQKISILSNYISILAVGEHKDMNSLLDYTVFQLKDEFKRYQMKQSFDMYVNARLAGASDLDEVDNWMEDIHS